MIYLPKDILFDIFSYFDEKTLGRTAIVCKQFKSISEAAWDNFALQQLGKSPLEAYSISARDWCRNRKLTLRGLEKLGTKTTQFRIYVPIKSINQVDLNLSRGELTVIGYNSLIIYDCNNGANKKTIQHIPFEVIEGPQPKISCPCQDCHSLNRFNKLSPHHLIAVQLSETGQSTERNTIKIEAIYDLARGTFTAACQGEMLYAKNEFVVFLEESGLLKVKNVQTKKIIFSTKIDSNKEFAAAEHGADLKDDFLLLATADKRLIGFNVKEEKQLFSLSLATAENILGFKVLNDKRFVVQTGANTTLLYDIQSANVIKTLSFSLWPSLSPKEQTKQAIQESQNKFVVYDLKSSSKTGFILNSLTGDIEYKCVLKEQNLVYLVNNRLIIISSQANSSPSIDLYDLSTYQLIISDESKLAKFNLNTIEVNIVESEHMVVFKSSPLAPHLTDYLFFNLVDGQFTEPNSEIKQSLNKEFWTYKEGNLIRVLEMDDYYFVYHHHFTEPKSEATVIQKVSSFVSETIKSSGHQLAKVYNSLIG